LTSPPSDAPPRFLRPQDLRRFHSFRFAARLVVEGFYAGRHRSPYHDASAEFADYRPYVPGDELRSLDWRAYARTDRDYVKLFRKETDMRCHVLLDISRSMAFRGEPEAEPPTVTPARRASWWRRLLEGRENGRPDAAVGEGLSKFEYGAYLAAALCYLMIQQGDKASLALGADALQTFVPPGGTMTHLHSLLYPLEQVRPEGPTHLSAALSSLFLLARRKGLLVVISDFLEEPEPLFRALSMYTYRGWQVLLLHLLTETEQELPDEQGTLRFLDSEGPGSLEADPEALRAAYKAELKAHLDTLETQAKARRIHYARMTTSTPYDRALERYLTTRSHS
jgi:uncharacterized protein (DUF58 family)